MNHGVRTAAKRWNNTGSPAGGILQGGASKPIGSANNKKHTPTGYFFVVRISNHKRMPTAFSPGSETQVDENEHREV